MVALGSTFFSVSRLLWPVLCCLLLSLSAQAAAVERIRAEPVILTDAQERYDLSLELRYLKDPEGRYTLDDVIELWNQSASTEQQEKTLNFGFTDAAYWFHVRLYNRGSDQREWLLETLYPIIDRVDAFWVFEDGRRKHQISGDSITFATRSKQHHNINFAFDLPKGEAVDIFLRAKTSGAIQMPLVLWSEDAFSAKDHQEQLVFGLYYGLIIAMAIYNLLIFFAIRDINYLWYVLYIVNYGLMQFAINGLAFENLWSDSPWWNNRAVAFFIGFGMIFILAFSRSFLSLKVNGPRIDRFFKVAMVCFAIICGLALFGPYNLAIRLATLIATIMVAAIFATGVYCWMKRFKPARYFMISWTVLLFGMMCYTLKTFGILPANFVTEYAIQIGSAFEVVLLSLALADRIRVLTLENQRMQHELTEELESRVRDRTIELESANRMLEELSVTDGLTGVRNRRHFNQAILAECRRTSREGPLSVLLIDVDHFKQFNDTYGHQVGDDCLVTVAKAIRDSVRRESDVVARYGGEEFAVILPSTKREGAMQVAELIRNKIRNSPIMVNSQPVHISVSVGVTTTEQHEQCDPTRVVQVADRALYVSKEQGRDRCSFMDFAAGCS